MLLLSLAFGVVDGMMSISTPAQLIIFSHSLCLSPTGVVLCLRWAIELHVVMERTVKHRMIARLIIFFLDIFGLSMFYPSCIYDLWRAEIHPWIVWESMMHENQFPANKKRNKLMALKIPILCILHSIHAALWALAHTQWRGQSRRGKKEAQPRADPMADSASSR